MGDKSPVFLPEMRNFIPDLPDEKKCPAAFLLRDAWREYVGIEPT